VDEKFKKIKKNTNRLVFYLGIKNVLRSKENYLIPKILELCDELDSVENSKNVYWLIDSLRDDINDIVLNINYVSPRRLKWVCDKIIKKAKLEDNEEGREKAVNTIYMSIILFFAFNINDKNVCAGKIIAAAERYYHSIKK